MRTITVRSHSTKDGGFRVYVSELGEHGASCSEYTYEGDKTKYKIPSQAEKDAFSRKYEEGFLDWLDKSEEIFKQHEARKGRR